MKLSTIIAVAIGFIIGALCYSFVFATDDPSIVYTEATILLPSGDLMYVDIAHLSDIEPSEAVAAIERVTGGHQLSPYVLTGFRRFTIPVRERYDPDAAPIDATSSITTALIQWNGYSPAFSYSYVGEGNVAGSSICDGDNPDGINSISWRDQPGPILGTACWSGSDECDIVVDSTYGWTPTILRGVVAHESGHCLGLGHSADSSALMYAVYHGINEPQPDDIAGLCAIYGCANVTPTPTRTATPTATATRTPTPIPTYTPTPIPHLLCWRLVYPFCFIIPGLAHN